MGWSGRGVGVWERENIDYVIDKPWLLSRFWVYCKLYHNLVTFHCLTPNEVEPSLGQTVKGHQIMI